MYVCMYVCMYVYMYGCVVLCIPLQVQLAPMLDGTNPLSQRHSLESPTLLQGTSQVLFLVSTIPSAKDNEKNESNKLHYNNNYISYFILS